MLLKTRGIIFRTKKYSESSLIVDIYTEAKGLRSYIVSGVRSKRAKFSPSLLQVMTLVDVVVYHRENKGLTRIKEIQPAYIFRRIPFDMTCGAIGLFMAEIARKTIRESEEHTPLFQFLFDSFQHLDETTHSVANLHLYFMLHLSLFLGFLPGGEASEETPLFDMREGHFIGGTVGHRYFMEERLSFLMSELLLRAKEEVHQVEMTRKERQLLLKGLLDFYRLHIDNFPEIHAHAILETVLS